MVIKPADFHSGIEINLDGTDEQELYDTMVERILEKMVTFQNEEILKTKLHGSFKICHL